MQPVNTHGAPKISMDSRDSDYQMKWEFQNVICFSDSLNFEYSKVTSSNVSWLEAHVGFFRLLMK